MPIDVRIDGNPESIRGAAAWLRTSLSAGVHDCVSAVYRIRGNSETEWEGDAGTAFRARMTSGGSKGDRLEAEATRAAQSFDAYADDLHTALAGRDRAVQTALNGGLEVSGDQILDPGPAPTAPQALPSDGSATPEMVRGYDNAVQAQQVYAQKTTAYAVASEEMARSRQILTEAKSFGQNVWNDVRGKAVLHAADFTNGTVGALAARHATVLRKHATFLEQQAARHVDHYLKSGGGSTSTARYNVAAADEARRQADDALRRASSVARRIGGKVPIIGLGITAAGVGYDVHQGKPVGKAVISGVGGAASAMLVGAAVGGPVGAVVGLGVGIVVGGGLDWGYDQLPGGVQDGIEDGFKAVGGGVKDAWNSVF
ncbi:MAG: hypothetical protein ACR2FQ_04740 [Pseudonocardiaceae bacterium]